MSNARRLCLCINNSFINFTRLTIFFLALTNAAGIYAKIATRFWRNYEENKIFISIIYHRKGGMKLMLVATTAKDEFTLEQAPNARIKFVRDAGGKVTEIEILTPSGSWEKIRKN